MYEVLMYECNVRMNFWVIILCPVVSGLRTGHKIMTQKFTKNISYMIHPSSCHII